MTIYNLEIDVNDGESQEELWLNQNENDFIIQIRLYVRSGIFTIPSDSVVFLHGTLPDGTNYSKAGIISKTEISITGDASLTSIAGDGVFYITLASGNKQMNTPSFIIHFVQRG